MPQKTKNKTRKIASVLLLIAQLIISLILNMTIVHFANAQKLISGPIIEEDSPQFYATNPQPNDAQTSSSDQPAPAQPKKDSSENASSSFNVNYLSAEGQNQTYLKSKMPIAAFIIQIINFLIMTIGSFAFLAVVAGGFILLASHGSEEMVTKGKDILKFAIIGLVIALSAYFITAFVQSIFYELPS